MLVIARVQDGAEHEEERKGSIIRVVIFDADTVGPEIPLFRNSIPVGLHDYTAESSHLPRAAMLIQDRTRWGSDTLKGIFLSGAERPQ